VARTIANPHVTAPVEGLAPVPRSPWRRPFLQDSLISGALTTTSVIGVVTDMSVDLPEGAAEVSAGIDELGIALVLAQTVPVAWRRRAPVVILSIVTAALFLYSVLGYVRSFAALGFLLALYTLAAYEERPVSVPIGVAAGAIVLLILGFGPEPLEPDGVIATVLIVGATWFIGDSVRIRRGEFVRLEDRATMLEREREALAKEAVATERRVIARELHDVVAHDVSVIVTQAAAARRLAGRSAQDALQALPAIEHAGREALVEMRRLMGFLRPDGASSALAPQPGLGDLPALCAQVREAGLPLELRVEGERRPLSPGLDLSAYRIVQEAVTNAMKHAGRARVTVDVCYLPTELRLRIDDDGVGASRWRRSASPGYGHLGMRERVALFGGSLWVGPRDDGGFRVAATLPIEEEIS
jgi:signal transduction histidine kinase